MDKENTKERTGDMFVPRDCYWIQEAAAGYEEPIWRAGELQSWVQGNPLCEGNEILGVVEDAETGNLHTAPVSRIRFRRPGGQSQHPQPSVDLASNLGMTLDHLVVLERLMWEAVEDGPLSFSKIRDRDDRLGTWGDLLSALVSESPRLELNPELNCFVQRKDAPDGCWV